VTEVTLLGNTPLIFYAYRMIITGSTNLFTYFAARIFFTMAQQT